MSPVDNPVTRRYLTGEYLAHNPTWDSEDSVWKAHQVLTILHANGIRPATVVDVGCGAGAVLAELRKALPNARFTGFDIAPDAQRFWKHHAGIEFRLGDFLTLSDGRYDVLLALDVLEHLQDPFDFLVRIRPRAAHFVFHFPLDLSALTVLREAPLLNQRRQVGHIHYYTRGLALALLEECGYEVVGWRYTGAAFTAPRRTVKTRVAALLRRAAYAVARDAGVRLLGGETLMVVARAGRAP